MPFVKIFVLFVLKLASDVLLKYFKKQNNDIYLRLKPHRNTALVNAKKLLEFNFEYPNKSVSEMYVLFETLFPETNKNKRD